MDKIYWNNKKYFFLLLAIWTGVLMTMYEIPGLLTLFRFLNNDTVKFSIIGGYADDYTMQSKIFCNIFMASISILSHLIIIAFSIKSIIKSEMTKAIGIIIFAQNVIWLSLTLWERFLTNNINEVYINIKWYLCFVIIITSALICLSLIQKIYYILLIVITALQGIESIRLLIDNFGHILEVGILNMLFYSGNCIIIIILYWSLVFVQYRYDQQQTAKHI